MASSKQVLVLAVVAAVACLASLASASLWMVGNEGGWRAHFNQTGWADGATFDVGDGLLFRYSKDNHTVAQVTKDDFEACNLHGNFLGLWDSGFDVVTLDKPGKAWFICTKPNHCDGGMKLAVDVVGGTTVPAPAPSPIPFPGVPGMPVVPGVPMSPRIPAIPAAPMVPMVPGIPMAPMVPMAPAPSPIFRSPFPWWWGTAPAPAPVLPVAAPPSAAVRNPVGGAVAMAAAAVVVAALAF